MLWRPLTVTRALSCGCLLPGPWAVVLTMYQLSAWSASIERRRNWKKFHYRGQCWSGWAVGWQDHSAALYQELRGPVLMFMGSVCPGLPPTPSHRALWLSPQPSHSSHSGPRLICPSLHSHCGHVLSLLRDLHGSSVPTTENQHSTFKTCVIGVNAPFCLVPQYYQEYPGSPPFRPS